MPTWRHGGFAAAPSNPRLKESPPAAIEPTHAASASLAMPTWRPGGFAAAPSNPHPKEMPPAGIEPTRLTASGVGSTSVPFQRLEQRSSLGPHVGRIRLRFHHEVRVPSTSIPFFGLDDERPGCTGRSKTMDTQSRPGTNPFDLRQIYRAILRH